MAIKCISHKKTLKLKMQYNVNKIIIYKTEIVWL